MTVRSGRASTAATSPGAELSPAESLMIYGDRLFDTRKSPGFRTARLPLSGRHMSVDKLAFAGLCGALGALTEAGAVGLALEPRKGLIRTRDQVLVRHRRAGHKWPRQSPETRLSAWLADRPGGEAWLEDLITLEMVPEVNTFPRRVALEYLMGGLMARGIVERVQRRTFLFFPINEYQVVNAAAAGLRGVKERTVDAGLRCHEQLSVELHNACREAWRGAITLRSDTP